MTDAVDVQDVADPVWDLLNAIDGVTAFDSEFVDDQGRAVEPPADLDGRVRPYAVYYPGPGLAHALLSCGGTDSLDWGFQVTCAGGDRRRALWCVSEVRRALSGHTLLVRGQELCIRETTPNAPLRRDRDVAPPRFYSALLFDLNC